MSDELFPPSFSAPETPAFVDRDLLCNKCGYNLRTVSVSGVCPECGADVARSLRGDTLSGADPEWLGKIHMAVTLMLLQVAASFILGLCSGVMKSVEIQLAVNLIVSILSLAGTWLLTSPEPRAALLEQSVTLRKALRVCAVLGFISSLIHIASLLGNSQLLQLVGIIISLPTIASLWLVFLYLSKLSSRIPDHGMAKQFRVVMWGFTSAIGIVIVGGLIAALGGGTGVLVLMCPAMLGFLVFGIWSLVLLARFRTQVGRCLEVSRSAPLQPPSA